MSLGGNIRKSRIECGLTQQQAAVRVGVSTGMFGRYERDEDIPGGDVFAKLQTELKLQVSDIAGQTPSEPAQLVIPFDKIFDVEIQLQRRLPDSVQISIRVKREAS